MALTATQVEPLNNKINPEYYQYKKIVVCPRGTKDYKFFIITLAEYSALFNDNIGSVRGKFLSEFNKTPFLRTLFADKYKFYKIHQIPTIELLGIE